MSANDNPFERKLPGQLPALAERTFVATILIGLLLAWAVLGLPSRYVRLLEFVERDKTDVAGYSAASLVLATFCMRSMGKLRVVALASNVAFIAYGYLADLMPVLVLHAILLPVNAYRLMQLTWVEIRTKPASNKPAG